MGRKPHDVDGLVWEDAIPLYVPPSARLAYKPYASVAAL